MAEILHQLIDSLSYYFQDLYIPGGAGYQPSKVCFVGKGVGIAVGYKQEKAQPTHDQIPTSVNFFFLTHQV